MNKYIKSGVIAFALLAVTFNLMAEENNENSAGMGEYKDWRLFSVSHREDNNSMRVILGNYKTIKAVRAGKTQPWPDGVIFAKVIWKESRHPNWAQAIVPGEFKAAEAMIKDSKKYASTGGWGFAHWQGKKLVMHDKETSDKCFACHTIMKDKDYVFNGYVLK